MSREHHTEGVISAAEMIRQDIFPFLDKEKVYTAAKNHDILKDIEPKSAVEEYNLPEDMLLSPAVIHAFAGGEYLLRQGLDADIADAVRYHTTGRPNMTDIEKIIFVADLAEPGRNFPELELLRKLAFSDIDKAFYECVRRTVAVNEKRNHPIHPNAYEILKTFEKE